MKVIVTGSFNPITKGHEDVVLRAAKIFDEVIVAVFNNAEKNYEFSLEEREILCRKAFEKVENVRVTSSDGMVVDLCRRENCFVLLRGIRDEKDMAYELFMSDANRGFDSRCETLFFPAKKSLSDCSSSEVRRRISVGEDYSSLVPENSLETLNGMLKKRGNNNEKQ